MANRDFPQSLSLPGTNPDGRRPTALLSFGCERLVSDKTGHKPTRMGNDVSPYA